MMAVAIGGELRTDSNQPAVVDEMLTGTYYPRNTMIPLWVMSLSAAIDLWLND